MPDVMVVKEKNLQKCNTLREAFLSLREDTEVENGFCGMKGNSMTGQVFVKDTGSIANTF
jgi:hypothetical protein